MRDKHGSNDIGRAAVGSALMCLRKWVSKAGFSDRVEKRSQWSCCAVARGGSVCENAIGFRAADVLDLAAQRSQHPFREF